MGAAAGLDALHKPFLRQRTESVGGNGSYVDVARTSQFATAVLAQDAIGIVRDAHEGTHRGRLVPDSHLAQQGRHLMQLGTPCSGLL